MTNFTIATVIGARPQFVKAAAVSRVIAVEPDVVEHIIHTGQHFDDRMSGIFFRELDIPQPRFNLEVKSTRHGEMTGLMIDRIESVLLDIRPDLMLVYGDTNSTLAGALAAAKLHVPVAHVEAGLRSFNRLMPEEVNRVLTDHISFLHFCPTVQSVKNLAREGITENVHHTGDVMFDATLHAKTAASQRAKLLQEIGVADGNYAVCTMHRAENTDDERRLKELCSYLETVAQRMPVVFPIHPRTRQAVTRFGIGVRGVILIEPLGYLDLHALLASASEVYTDSGGMQKEAYFHGKPCVTLRDETEWVETIEHGWNRLWRTPEYAELRTGISDYGEGHAAEKIVGLIREYGLSRQ